ncbi:MAG: outer membrane beta-barrel protein [Gemmatimonadaceae bacterium]
MIRKFVGIVSIVSAMMLTANSADAQRFGTPAMSISPYAGYMRFDGVADGPLNSNLTTASAPIYGAQINFPLGRTISILGNVAYSEPDLRAGIPVLGNVSVGKSNVLLYDAGLQFSAPAGFAERSIIPFLQLGAGAMKYDIDVAGFSRSATNLAFNAGIGVDVPLGRNIGLRLAAKDYIGKFDFAEATTIDYDPKTSHNVALSAGLKLGF